MALPDEMVVYRAKHRMSQKELAKKCGVSSQTIYLIETGQQSPSRVTEAKIKLAIKEDE